MSQPLGLQDRLPQPIRLAEEKILSDTFDLVILDEITYLPHYDFLAVDEIIDILEKKPKRLSVIITGRNADEKMIAQADTVTIMAAQKHAFEQGIKAQKGIEY